MRSLNPFAIWSAVPLATRTASVIKSIQHFTITISGGGGTTGTATLSPAVVVAKTALIHLGTRGSNSAPEMANTIVLTNTTTVTATRAGATSDAVTVSGVAVEFY